MTRISFLRLAYFAQSLLLYTDAFAPTPTLHIKLYKSGNIKVSLHGSSSNDEDDSSFDIESEREKLNRLLGGKIESDDEKRNRGEPFSVTKLISPYHQVSLPSQPPITAMERDRRLAEIQVLKRLAHGDDATADLWKLWYNERGPTAKAVLDQVDVLMDETKHWKQCELLLLGLINKYGVYFVEPVNRLATLYYLQARYEQSYKLCQVVLEIKPWHFGALSGIVAVCIAKGDREKARFWAERILPNAVASSSFPPFSENGPANPKRHEWVDRAVQNAAQALQDAERRTAESLGKPESYYKKQKDQNIEEPEDPWQ